MQKNSELKKVKLSEYFMNPMKQQLDIEKLTLAVDNVVLGLRTNKTTIFKHYDTEYIVKKDFTDSVGCEQDCS